MGNNIGRKTVNGGKLVPGRNKNVPLTGRNKNVPLSGRKTGSIINKQPVSVYNPPKGKSSRTSTTTKTPQKRGGGLGGSKNIGGGSKRAGKVRKR